MNKDQIKGNVDQAVGKTKEVIGRAVGNPDKEAEGTAQKTSGKIQEGFGNLKEKAKDAIDSL